MATEYEIKKIMEYASVEELACFAQLSLQCAMENDMTEVEQYHWTCFMGMITAEAERREIEPLWRKTRRLVVRNSDTIKQIGKIAAGVTIGVFLGGSILDIKRIV